MHMKRSLLFAFLTWCAAANAQTRSLTDFSGALERLAAKVAPAVVQVQVSAWRPSAAGEEAAAFTRGRVVGSGVIVDSSGYIITNEHVIRNAKDIQVMLTPAPAPSDAEPVPIGKRSVLKAELVGANHQTDLALLKIQASGLPTIPIREAGRARQGQVVLAVGSPGGLDNTITLGVVSAVGRQPYPDYPMMYIQTDAAINPGNSGGPLLDVEGNLIGINTFILSESGGSQGLAFAIPAPVVRYIYDELKTHGTVRQRIIGVHLQTVTPALAQGLHLPQSYGVIISDVFPGSPAAIAGIQPRDIVTQVDGAPTLSLPYFLAAMYMNHPRATLKLTVLRNRETLELHVTPISVDDRDDDADASPETPNDAIWELGVLGKTVTPALASRMELRSRAGIYVVSTSYGNDDPDSGLAAGDVIVGLNGAPVANIQQLKQALQEVHEGTAAVVRIERRGQFQYVALEQD